jgi:iron complex transport system substrate-binding protein
LLPAATEIVASLGGAGYLVGISHECDYPPYLQHLPRVTATPIDPAASSAIIHAAVRTLTESGHPVIAIQAEQLLALRPDLIITQDLCEVCAVADGQVHHLAATLEGAQVLSLKARRLDGIWSDIRVVGAALGLADEAEELVLGLQSRLDRLRRDPPFQRPRIQCIEWLDPLYIAGHWMPELVKCAGGIDVASQIGAHSVRGDWTQLQKLEPDLILVMLCGFGVPRARRELELLDDPDALELLQGVPTYIIDGNAYTSRPGPRVVDGAIRIHSAIMGRPIQGMARWHPEPRYSHS